MEFRFILLLIVVIGILQVLPAPHTMVIGVATGDDELINEDRQLEADGWALLDFAGDYKFPVSTGLYGNVAVVSLENISFYLLNPSDHNLWTVDKTSPLRQYRYALVDFRNANVSYIVQSNTPLYILLLGSGGVTVHVRISIDRTAPIIESNIYNGQIIRDVYSIHCNVADAHFSVNCTEVWINGIEELQFNSEQFQFILVSYMYPDGDVDIKFVTYDNVLNRGETIFTVYADNVPHGNITTPVTIDIGGFLFGSAVIVGVVIAIAVPMYVINAHIKKRTLKKLEEEKAYRRHK